MRVALYARVSTTKKKVDAPADFEQDPEVQLVPLRADFRRRGASQIGQFIDRASGAAESRPELDRMMGEVRAGKCDAVAVWRFDRFARSTRHLLTVLDEFRVRGVQFISLCEQVDTSTPTGKLMFTLIAAFAEFERDLIRDRVRAGIARRQAKGLPVGKQRKVFDRDRAMGLRASGASLRSISQALGVPKSTIQDALREP